jgi:dihydrolipoamide dehydrogenase
MVDMSCDVAIIGAGTAGLAAERAGRKTGAKTLLIDDRFAETTCASVGCMPSKLLIAAADAAYNARRASTCGIETNISVDGRAVMARVRKERDEFVAATLKSIEKIPAGICIRQRARFSNATTLALGDGRKVSSKAIVIATGSRPSVPKPFDRLGEIVLTNETIFELQSLPRRSPSSVPARWASSSHRRWQECPDSCFRSRRTCRGAARRRSGEEP